MELINIFNLVISGFGPVLRSIILVWDLVTLFAVLRFCGYFEVGPQPQPQPQPQTANKTATQPQSFVCGFRFAVLARLRFFLRFFVFTNLDRNRNRNRNRKPHTANRKTATAISGYGFDVIFEISVFRCFCS